jgi:hypothetical protein
MRFKCIIQILCNTWYYNLFIYLHYQVHGIKMYWGNVEFEKIYKL